ncbi:MAG: hypothetical protein ACFFB5_16090 [Promethearchaeota archaeon]
MCLVLVTSGNTVSGIGRSEYHFIQLDSFFEKNLFGVRFDYNPRVSSGQPLRIINDLLDQSWDPNTTDPDLKEDNILSLVGYEAQDISSAFLALEQVKRTQDILIDSIEWQSAAPFVKYLHHFSLPTGEDVLLAQDFLGMALTVNGSGFNPIDYQLGYANVPLEFLEFLIPNDKGYSFNLSVETSIMIQESVNELQIDLTFSNLTFLFQTSGVALDNFGLEIAEHFMIVQFDYISFSLTLRKYSHYGTSGVETLSEISIGNVMNLIINEELPREQNWLNALNYTIQEDFKDLIPINETFSWYQGPDISERLQMFSNLSFSLITAQNIGVLNGTQVVNDLQVVIDDQNRTKAELSQLEFTVKDGISVIHDERILFSTQVKGRNFAIIQEDGINEISLVPMEARVIALNQQTGFADNLLFLQETSLLKELIVECIKRFIANPEISTLGISEVLNKVGLDLTSAQYIQDFQLVEWSGMSFKINLIQYAVKTAPSSTIKSKMSQVTLIPTVSVLLGLLILVVIVKRGNRGK